jgi:hypothetical protein
MLGEKKMGTPLTQHDQGEGMKGNVEKRTYGLVVVFGDEAYSIHPDTASAQGILVGDTVEFEEGGPLNVKGHRVMTAATVRKV